jgi:hypothetical protein
MKLIMIFVLLLGFTSKAQCDYSSVSYDNSTKKSHLISLPITLDLYETPYNGRFIQVFLIREGNSFFMEFELTRDSSSQDLKPVCFEKGDRVSFSLSDNSFVNLMQTRDKICGVKFEDNKNGFVSVTNYINVVITQEAFEKLIKSKVLLIKISSKDYNETFVLKNEIEELVNNEVVVTKPGRFFMDNIKCLTNPKL